MSIISVVRFVVCVAIAIVAYVATSFNIGNLARDGEDKNLIRFWSFVGVVVSCGYLLLALGGADGIYAFFEGSTETPYGAAEMAGEVGLWLTLCLIGLVVVPFYCADYHDALEYRDRLARLRHNRLLREWERNHQ